MLITNSNSNKSGFRDRTIGHDIKIGPLSIQFIVIIILAAMGLLYLAQSTQGATKNYKLQELAEQKEQELLEKQRLEVEATRLKSLNNIKDKASDFNLVSAE